MTPLKSGISGAASIAGNSGPVAASLGASPVTSDPVPASAISRVTPEPAIAGVAADVAMSETSNVRAARYATNLGFKDPSLLLMRLRRGGNSLQNAQPSPQARERQSESSRLVGLSSERASFLLFVRPTPI